MYGSCWATADSEASWSLDEIPRVVQVPSCRLTLTAESDPQNQSRMRRLFTLRSPRRGPELAASHGAHDIGQDRRDRPCRFTS